MSIYQDKAKECKCCGKHVPLPTVLKEYNETVLCPTTFANVLEYKRIWKASGKRPAGNIRKHFSEYVQQLVEETIDKNEDGTI
ncbi:MAG: hypothetical protein RLZZ196_905 [Bacteroidota bacterium]|jgi:hypothetical protein